MKKTTKGAIAAGAAAVLLAGGAGSFAAWNASTGTSTSTGVTAGSLTVTQQDDTGVWTWGNGGAFNPDTDLLVPGDVVKYTGTYDISLVGTNLKAQLVPTVAGVSGELESLGQLDVAADAATQTTYSAGEHTASFTTTVTFLPKDGTVDNVGQTKTASLSGGAVTLEQVITPAG